MKIRKQTIIGLLVAAFALLAFTAGAMAQDSCYSEVYWSGAGAADFVDPCETSNCSADPDWCDSILASAISEMDGNVLKLTVANGYIVDNIKRVTIHCEGTGADPNSAPYGGGIAGFNNGAAQSKVFPVSTSGTVDGNGNWTLDYVALIVPQPDSVVFATNISGSSPAITQSTLIDMCKPKVQIIKQTIEIIDPGNPPKFEPLIPGEILEIVNLTGIDIDIRFNNDDFSKTTALPNGESAYFEGTDVLDCYTVTETGSKSGQNAAYACEGTYGGEIPTLSEWGLIIFSLLLLSLMTIAIVRGKTILAGAGQASISMKLPLFVPAAYFKALTACMGLALLGCVGAMMVYGTIAARDMIGTIVSAGIVAYIAHLWMNSSEGNK